MSTLPDKIKAVKKKKQKPGQPAPLTHITVGAHRVAEAKRGVNVTARCGATIKGDPDPTAGLCVPCVIAQMEEDDKASDDRLQQRFDAGKRQGISEGQRNAVAEVQRVERERVERELTEARKPRFEVVGNRLKLTYQDGSVATVRRGRVASVRFGPNGSVATVRDGEGTHAVYVDGVVLFAHQDEALVREHYTQIHNAVFGNAE